jgi:hypothetical protein
MIKVKPKSIVFILLIFLAMALVIFLVPWEIIGLKIKALIFPLLFRFDTFIRPGIGYIGAFIVGAGLLFFLVKRFTEASAVKKWLSPLTRSFGKLTLPGEVKKRLPSLSGFLFIISMVVILLYFSPYIFKGEDAHIKIFDVLDAWLPQMKVLAESGKGLSLNPETQIPNLANGLRLSGFNSGYNVSAWLFMIFRPFTAYTLNLLIMAFTAFWGMALLLKKFIIKSEEYSPLIIGASLCFSLLTFYPPAGLSIAGFPLLLYFFLKIRNREAKKRDFIFIFIFPFYSLLHHAGMFIIIVLGVIFIRDFLLKPGETLSFRQTFEMTPQKERHQADRESGGGATPYFLALALLCGLYVFTHFHLIYSLVDPDFVSYRKEIVVETLSTAKCFEDTVGNFIFDRTNVVSGQQVFVLLAAAAAMLAGIFNGKDKRIHQLTIFILLALLNSFLWGFKYWAATAPLRENIQFLNTLNFARFYWLNPVLWGIIFALSLLIISKVKYGKTLVSLLVIGQVLFIFTTYNPEYRHVLGLRNRSHSTLTFGQFYSEKLFKEIDHYIDKSKEDYRTVSIGIHPGIAQYNGFYTLDIYSNIYSLEYKHQFRKIIEKELGKNARIKWVYDENGKRCYLFVSDLYAIKWVGGMVFSRGITKKESPRLKIKNMELNIDVMKEMGCQYMFSAVKILDHQENQLQFEKVFERKDSPWKIYLYKVK